MNVAIVNYGMGNLRSVYNKLCRIGVDCVISADPAVLRQADALVLPGVGHYGRAMEKLHRLDLVGLLNERVLAELTPVLGICLGMQLLMESSEEGDVAGLGWIGGSTIRFRLANQAGLKVPHIGWNSVETVREHPLLSGLLPDDPMYFVHSYHVSLTDPADALQRTHYGYDFVSAVQKGHIAGFQYHPEKSQDAGMQLLRNFIHLVNAPAHVPTPRHSLSAAAQ